MNYRRIRLVRVGKTAPVAFAAKELTKYLKAADSQLVVDEMLTSAVPASGNNLVLRVSDELSEELNVRDARWDDGYRISVKNDVGVIEGTNERSVLLGAYRFLRELGFAFTRPGKKGERIPAALKDEYEIDILEAANYRDRGITIEGAITYENCRDMIDFIPKLGMNSYFVQFWVPGTFFSRWYDHEFNPYLEKEEISREIAEGFLSSLEEEITQRGIIYQKTGHGWTCEPFGIDGTAWDPEQKHELTEEQISYLAEVNGKRELWGNIPLNTNLCYSNPVVRSRITDSIRDYSIANPQIDVIQFWLADGTKNHCECPECRRKQPSDWYVMMLNELDEKLAEAKVDTRIVFILYFDLMWAPVEEKIKNPGRFTMMFAPITRYYGVNYEDTKPFEGVLPAFERNKSDVPASLEGNLELLKKWQEYFGGDSLIFDYHLQWAHVNDPGYELCAKNIFADMRYLHQMGFDGELSCQVQRTFFPSGIVLRAMAEGLWSKDSTFEEVLKKYYDDAFGDKGDAVREYLGKISYLCTNYEIDNSYVPEKRTEIRRDGVPFIRDYSELIKTIDDFLPVIEEGCLAGGQDAEDWKVLKVHAGYAKLFGRMLKVRDDSKDPENDPAITEAIEEIADYIARNEMSIQEAVDANNTIRVLRARIFSGV